MRVNKWRMNFNFGRTIFLWNSWANTIIVINVFHLVNKHFVLVNVIPKTYKMTNKHGVENAIFEKLAKWGAIIEVQKPMYFWSYWSFVIPKICLYPWSIQIYVDKEIIMIWLCDQIYLHMECCTALSYFGHSNDSVGVWHIPDVHLCSKVTPGILCM